jgi:DNA-binding PadR family transcriptional regulator
MSLSRLVVLGLLAEHGPLYGHELRRAAEARHVESWGGVGPGALYRELHQLEAEELIELVRNEQVGRRPPRAVYRVTDAGREALRALRAETLCAFDRPPDPVGVALLFGGSDDPEELLGALGRRHVAAVAALDTLKAKRARLEELGLLGASGRAVFRRAELYLGAELAWHEECPSVLASKTAGGLGTGRVDRDPSAVRDGTGGIGTARRRRAERVSTLAAGKTGGTTR